MHFITLLSLAMSVVRGVDWLDAFFRKPGLRGAVTENDVEKVRQFAKLKNDTYSLRKDEDLIVDPESYEKAIKNGNREILELLLNAKLNVWDFKPTSELITQAVRKGELEMVILFLKKGLGPNLEQYKNDILKNRLDVIKQYINHGFFPYDGLLAVAAKNGKLDVLKIILAGDGSAYRMEEIAESMSAVTWLGSQNLTIEHQILDIIEEYALKNLKNMEYRNPSKGLNNGASNTNLFDSIFLAIQRNDVARVRRFCEIKNETVSDRKNNHLIITPECYETAVRNGNKEILGLLLYTRMNVWDTRPSTRLINLAVECERMNILEFLVQNGVRPTYRQYKLNILANRVDLIRIYVENGIFPPDGLLSFAAKYGMLDVLKIVLVGDGSTYWMEEMQESLNVVKWSWLLDDDSKRQISEMIKKYVKKNHKRIPVRRKEVWLKSLNSK